MYEFDSVSASSYEASSLAAKLSEKSADGWEVVAIVPAGSDITAFLKRESTRSSTASTSTEPAAAVTAAAAEPAVSEPAGWGSAPASTGAAAGASGWGATTSGSDSSGWGSTSQAASTPATTPAASTPSTPSVPAGWYADPAGRYELRYWDGSAWTEHVSRAGQQYTDPPVA
jgi:hypothetical protein